MCGFIWRTDRGNSSNTSIRHASSSIHSSFTLMLRAVSEAAARCCPWGCVWGSCVCVCVRVCARVRMCVCACVRTCVRTCVLCGELFFNHGVNRQHSRAAAAAVVTTAFLCTGLPSNTSGPVFQTKPPRVQLQIKLQLSPLGEKHKHKYKRTTGLTSFKGLVHFSCTRLLIIDG